MGPVRSPIFKLVTGESVVRWVTTSEFSLLYVFAVLLFFLLFGFLLTYPGYRGYRYNNATSILRQCHSNPPAILYNTLTSIATEIRISVEKGTKRLASSYP